MGKLHSIGNRMWDELTDTSFSDIKVMSETATSKAGYQRFVSEMRDDPEFWNKSGMRKSITNFVEPHIEALEMDEALLARLKRDAERIGKLDQEIYAAEDAATREFFRTGERLHLYRTFAVSSTGSLPFSRALFDLMMKNFAKREVILSGDLLYVPVGAQPLSIHSDYNHTAIDNFHGITEFHSQINYHINLNTGGNYEAQTPFVIWLGADREVQCARYTVKYILDTGLVDEANKDRLLKTLFAAENCWEPVINQGITSGAVFNIIDPLYYKARYCTGDDAKNLEGAYALTAPNEALVFSSAQIHSSNRFPAATEPRLTAIIRAHDLDAIYRPEFQLNYAPGSTNSGVPLSDRVAMSVANRERVDHVFGKIFGYDGFRRTDYQSSLVPVDRYSVKFFEDHYEKAAPFLDQDQPHLSDEGRQAIFDFFREEARRQDARAAG